VVALKTRRTAVRLCGTLSLIEDRGLDDLTWQSYAGRLAPLTGGDQAALASRRRAFSSSKLT
jgi:hypothetical protein